MDYDGVEYLILFYRSSWDVVQEEAAFQECTILTLHSSSSLRGQEGPNIITYHVYGKHVLVRYIYVYLVMWRGKKYTNAKRSCKTMYYWALNAKRTSIKADWN